MFDRRQIRPFLTCVLLAAALALPVLAQSGAESAAPAKAAPTPVVYPAVHSDLSMPLRDMKRIPPPWEAVEKRGRRGPQPRPAQGRQVPRAGAPGCRPGGPVLDGRRGHAGPLPELGGDRQPGQRRAARHPGRRGPQPLRPVGQPLPRHLGQERHPGLRPREREHALAGLRRPVRHLQRRGPRGALRPPRQPLAREPVRPAQLPLGALLRIRRHLPDLGPHGGLVPLRLQDQRHQDGRLPQARGLVRRLLHDVQPVRLCGPLGRRGRPRLREGQDAHGRPGRAHHLLRPGSR